MIFQETNGALQIWAAKSLGEEMPGCKNMISKLKPHGMAIAPQNIDITLYFNLSMGF